MLGAALAVVHADAAHRIEGIPAALSFLVVAIHIAAAVAWVGVILFAILSPERRLVRLAAGATGVLLLSGAGLAIGHLTAVRDLVVTAYGMALAVKLGVIAAALGLGALGRRRAELAVASAALAAAATLVSLLPPT